MLFNTRGIWSSYCHITLIQGVSSLKQNAHTDWELSSCLTVWEIHIYNIVEKWSFQNQLFPWEVDTLPLVYMWQWRPIEFLVEYQPQWRVYVPVLKDVWDEQREEGFPVCILWVYICFSARVQGGHWRKLSEEGTLWLWMLLLQLLYPWDIGERRRIPKNTGWEREGKAPIDETSLLLIILSGIAVWPQQ